MEDFGAGSDWTERVDTESGGDGFGCAGVGFGVGWFGVECLQSRVVFNECLCGPLKVNISHVQKNAVRFWEQQRSFCGWCCLGVDAYVRLSRRLSRPPPLCFPHQRRTRLHLQTFMCHVSCFCSVLFQKRAVETCLLCGKLISHVSLRGQTSRTGIRERNSAKSKPFVSIAGKGEIPRKANLIDRGERAAACGKYARKGLCVRVCNGESDQTLPPSHELTPTVWIAAPVSIIRPRKALLFP